MEVHSDHPRSQRSQWAESDSPRGVSPATSPDLAQARDQVILLNSVRASKTRHAFIAFCDGHG